MELFFYFFSAVALISTLYTILLVNPIYSLLCFIMSLIAISGIFFTLGAFFAGALEIILYAGAIMVLFIFVIMMLNLSNNTENKEKKWSRSVLWIGPGILSFSFLILLAYGIYMIGTEKKIVRVVINAKEVGSNLFGPYYLIVEFASMLLLAALIVSLHLSKRIKYKKQCIKNGRS